MMLRTSTINENIGSFDAQYLRLLDGMAEQSAAAGENEALLESIKIQLAEAVMALAAAIEAKDRYTGGHTRRVAFFSELIAKHMGLKFTMCAFRPFFTMWAKSALMMGC